jgi:hypothetical protein
VNPIAAKLWPRAFTHDRARSMAPLAQAVTASAWPSASASSAGIRRLRERGIGLSDACSTAEAAKLAAWGTSSARRRHLATSTSVSAVGVLFGAAQRLEGCSNSSRLFALRVFARRFELLRCQRDVMRGYTATHVRIKPRGTAAHPYITARLLELRGYRLDESAPHGRHRCSDC